MVEASGRAGRLEASGRLASLWWEKLRRVERPPPIAEMSTAVVLQRMTVEPPRQWVRHWSDDLRRRSYCWCWHMLSGWDGGRSSRLGERIGSRRSCCCRRGCRFPCTGWVCRRRGQSTARSRRHAIVSPTSTNSFGVLRGWSGTRHDAIRRQRPCCLARFSRCRIDRLHRFIVHFGRRHGFPFDTGSLDAIQTG